MRKALLLVLVLALSAPLLHCGKHGTTTYQVPTTKYQATIAPVHSEWPITREASGQWEVVGEVSISNSGTGTLTIESVSVKVFDAGNYVLAEQTYSSDYFSKMLRVLSTTPPGTFTLKPVGTRELAPTDLAFSHVAALAGAASVPVRAEVTASFTNGKSETADVPLYEFDPRMESIWPVPFGVYDWVALNTSEAYVHWTGFNIAPVTHEYSTSQRFAIDISQVDSQYKLSNPPDSPNKEDYYSWGRDILSAGAGTVVIVEKSRADQEIGSTDEAWEAGNYVVIQHALHLFSFYAHMMNNSASVNVGDAVVSGQVIGKIGNSGRSTAPHLHFQYMDDEDYLTGQGLPALFWNAKVQRLSNSDLLNILGEVPDIRLQNSLLTSGTYTMNGTTPLEYDIVSAL